jgi:hypothetical protein
MGMGRCRWSFDSNPISLIGGLKMNKILKYLALPLLLVSLAACNGDNDGSSSLPVEIQTDWTIEEIDLMHSILRSNEEIPFHEIFVAEGNEYSIIRHSEVDKISAELYLPEKMLDSLGEVYYDPLDDLELYKDFCLDKHGYVLHAELSNLEEHDYHLSKVLNSGIAHVDVEIVLEIYMSLGYLVVDGYNVTTYTTTFWPSKDNLNDHSYDDEFASLNEVLSLQEEVIPSLVSNTKSIPMEVSYLHKMYRGQEAVEMSIETTDANLLINYVDDLLSSTRYVLDAQNSTVAYDDYYSEIDSVDIFLFKEQVNHCYKILFVHYW